MQERPRPEVTVTDPARPGTRFVAVPVDEEEQRPSSPHRRRWLAFGAGLVLAGAAVLVGQDVVEQRRLDRVVDVTLAGPLLPTSRWSYDRSSGTATLEAVLRLRNTGPRPVRVVSARLGELRFRGDAPLDAQTGTAVVALTRTVRCPRDGSRPPRESATTDAVVGVVTPAGEREVVLRTDGPASPSRLAAAGACGYPPLEDAVHVVGTVVGDPVAQAPGDGDRVRVQVRVDVTHFSRRRAQLVSLAFARGLEPLSYDGGRTTLPVDLGRPRLGDREVTTVDVLLGINCGALLATGGIGLGDLDVLVEDVDDEDLAQVTGRIDDAGALRQVVRRTCSSG